MSNTDLTQEPSGWVVGGVVFAATTMLIVGMFQAFEGLAAIINDQFYVVTPNYAFEFDITTWGWIHLVIGILVAIGGFFLFSGSGVAGVFAITMAALGAISNFFFIPYYPFWSILIIALSIWVIWAIAKSGIVSS